MYLVADIGGTKTRIAVSNDAESLSEPRIIDTPKDYASCVGMLTEAARQMGEGEKIEAAAVDISGVITGDRRRVARSLHLSFLAERELAGDLERELGGANVVLSNDVEQVGMGEAVYGAGRGASIVVYITVSTGVNGVRVVNGIIEPSASGFEIGGQYIGLGPVPTTLEDVISGHAVTEKYGKQPWEIEKDSHVWEELSLVTAYGVHNTILHWSPNRVVLGGSMFKEVGISVERVAAHVREVMKKFPDVPEIVHSSLGDVGGLWGGLAILKRR